MEATSGFAGASADTLLPDHYRKKTFALPETAYPARVDHEQVPHGSALP